MIPIVVNLLHATGKPHKAQFRISRYVLHFANLFVKSIYKKQSLFAQLVLFHVGEHGMDEPPIVKVPYLRPSLDLVKYVLVLDIVQLHQEPRQARGTVDFIGD